MQFYPLCRLNMMNTIHRTVFICCLGSSMCKAEDFIKIGKRQMSSLNGSANKNIIDFAILLAGSG